LIVHPDNRPPRRPKQHPDAFAGNILLNFKNLPVNLPALLCVLSGRREHEMAQMGTKRLGLAILGTCVGLLLPPSSWAQAPARNANPMVVTVEQPDAQRTKDELTALLERYPPALRHVLGLDPTLLDNQAYLAPYPALVSFLSAHPEIARNPSFYIENSGSRYIPPPGSEIWRQILDGIGVFGGFGMAIALLVWLVRTLVDYRRWNRLAKVQTDVHTKILDRFTANDDMLAYIQSPAGSKFLQSSPILLDAGPRSVGAPLGRILWSVQGGVVLLAGGIGLQVVSTRVTDDASQPLHALGVLGIALGLGFMVSAIISFVISQRLGLIEPAAPLRPETPGTGSPE
jgi:hypothetical protein